MPDEVQSALTTKGTSTYTRLPTCSFQKTTPGPTTAPLMCILSSLSANNSLFLSSSSLRITPPLSLSLSLLLLSPTYHPHDQACSMCFGMSSICTITHTTDPERWPAADKNKKNCNFVYFSCYVGGTITDFYSKPCPSFICIHLQEPGLVALLWWDENQWSENMQTAIQTLFKSISQIHLNK